MPRWLVPLVVLGALAFPRTAPAVEIAWVTILGTGTANACDFQPDPTPPACFGAVAETYRIGQFEVTNAQYAEFLNAVAASDPLELWDSFMAVDPIAGGIVRSGSPGSFSYAVKPGFEEKPVVVISWFSALRFANWLHNGQGSGDTESGAYTLLGGTPVPSNEATVSRNPGARVFLPTEDQWYKAAYYDAERQIYFDYPTRSDRVPGCVPPSEDDGNAANCRPGAGGPVDVGSYPLSPSPYGTFDQGGNVREWTETDFFGSGFLRQVRGGSWSEGVLELRARDRDSFPQLFKLPILGFRVASFLPEPDADGDGVPDFEDNCPEDANPGQEDLDDDGVGDVCDNCVPFFNPAQTDEDSNGTGDLCDTIASLFGGGVSREEFDTTVSDLGSRLSLLEGSDAAQSAALQGLRTDVTTLQSELAAIRAFLAALEARLDALEARIEAIEALPGIERRLEKR